MGEVAPPGSELAQFLAAHGAELMQRASDITELALSLDGIELGGVVQTVRPPLIAESVVSLEIGQAETGLDEQFVANQGIRVYAQIAAAKRAGIGLLARDRAGTLLRLNFDSMTEEQDALSETIDRAPGSVLEVFFQNFLTDLSRRASNVTQLAESMGQKQGLAIATRDMGILAITNAALEMERAASGLSFTDIANRGVISYAYLASLQQAGVELLYEDSSRVRQTLPDLTVPEIPDA